MYTFFDEPGLLPGFADLNRPRAIAAGLDPFQYDQVTAGLTAIREWPTAFVRAGQDYVARAEQAEAHGRSASAAEAYRAAALWLHFATVLPNRTSTRTPPLPRPRPTRSAEPSRPPSSSPSPTSPASCAVRRPSARPSSCSSRA
ncbi:hypothetical protein GCM10011581_42820 [Saccharopolyspora subtropica]|uniref:Uncharacterized protein n=1 Tax=Saccharopolyspora thermophila TaxID=89367 RepID=A0A917NHH8_9PSEU|nr:hypothetical protein [Saccharopolyspora subtropica]GGJ01085.1 hypothetical protein GCM10011581_42820 [Saccharopolyspora subtropica]